MKKKTILWTALIIFIVAVVGLLVRNRLIQKSKIAQNVPLLPTVSTTVVQKKSLQETLSLVGTLEAVRDVVVVSETSGRVVAVRAEVGDKLVGGSEIVRVDDELKLASFRTAEVNFEKAKKDLSRYENLYASKAATDAEVEAARLNFKAGEAQFLTARRQYQDARIKSPIPGILTSRSVDLGDMVQPGTAVANVVDISSFKAIVNLAEKDINKVKVGDRVNVTSDLLPGQAFSAKVLNLSVKGDEAHSYRVEISIPNPQGSPLKAQMFCRITFPVLVKRESVVIPREALTGSRKDPQVFVLRGDRVALLSITLGAEVETDVEVLKGLNPGETIVVSGQQNIGDGARVSAVPLR